MDEIIQSYPLVSVIVTTYNREHYLKETLHSIIGQTFTNFELIVVDNYSNYDFFGVIAGIKDNRIKAYQNDNKGIIAENRNFGISKATGKYLAFCDDDDIWEKDKLEYQVNYAKNHDKVIIATSSTYINESSLYQGARVYDPYKSIYELYLSCRITYSSVLVKNDELIKFNTRPFFCGIEDYILWLDLIHNGFNICIIPYEFVRYRVFDKSYSKTDKLVPIRRIVALTHMQKKYKNLSFLYYYLRALIYNIRVYIMYYLLNIKR